MQYDRSVFSLSCQSISPMSSNWEIVIVLDLDGRFFIKRHWEKTIQSTLERLAIQRRNTHRLNPSTIDVFNASMTEKKKVCQRDVDLVFFRAVKVDSKTDISIKFRILSHQFLAAGRAAGLSIDNKPDSTDHASAIQRTLNLFPWIAVYGVYHREPAIISL